MYYLARAGISNPAEAPHLARLDENYEWGYGQHKHQESLKNIRGLVDQSAPKTRDPVTQRAQASTRKFCEDQKRAEIGRENRKLVDRLSTIARGTTDRGDPRGPPPSSSLVGNALRGRQRPSAVEAANAHNAALAAPGSLNSQFRRKTQRHIDQDNAALVRRILAVKSTFDRKEEAKHYKRHERAVHLLQRLPDSGAGTSEAAGKSGGSRKRLGVPRSLPPLRQSRSLASMTAPVTGLKELFVPGELRRSTSLSGLGSEATSVEGPQPMYLSNAPSGTAVEADLGFQRHGRGPFSPGGDGLNPDTNTRTLNEGGAFGAQLDAETERRQWLMEEEARRSRQGQSQSQDASPSRGGLSAPASDNPWLSGAAGAGLSGSDMPKFADGWDENSFENSSGSPSKSRATGAGWRADPGMTVHEDTVSNFGLQGRGRDQPSSGVGLAGGGGGGSSEDLMRRTMTGTSVTSYASDGFESDATESGTESELGSTTRGASRSTSGAFNSSNKRAR